MASIDGTGARSETPLSELLAAATRLGVASPLWSHRPLTGDTCCGEPLCSWHDASSAGAWWCAACLSAACDVEGCAPFDSHVIWQTSSATGALNTASATTSARRRVIIESSIPRSRVPAVGRVSAGARCLGWGRSALRLGGTRPGGHRLQQIRRGMVALTRRGFELFAVFNLH